MFKRFKNILEVTKSSQSTEDDAKAFYDWWKELYKLNPKVKPGVRRCKCKF